MGLLAIFIIVLAFVTVGYSVGWALATERASRECVAAARAEERAHWERATERLRDRVAKLEASEASLKVDLGERCATVLYAACLARQSRSMAGSAREREPARATQHYQQVRSRTDQAIRQRG